MAKILVTGVAGFIAHRTAEMLLDAGHTVLGLDNINDYYDVKLKEMRLSSLKSRDGFEFFKVDIENKSDLQWFFENNKGIDKVLNLAARAGVRYSMENPDIYVSTNMQGTLNLLEACREFGIKKFLLASTSSLYAGKEMPFVESLDVSQPISPYAASKKGAEAMCYSYHHLYGIDVSIVRYFTVYGPFSRPDMAQMRFMRWIDQGDEIQLYGDGEQARDFTYVDDIARGTILAMKDLGYEIVNLGGGNNPISINKMIETFETQLGKKAIIKNLPFNKSDMRDTWADISKAKSMLGWEPEVGFDAGMTKCVEHYQANKNFYLNLDLN
jgi:UDP-glucuronate 4-epimerase